jgi:DNA-binding transcriptional ArsR family regulator
MSELELAHVLRTVGDPVRLAILRLPSDDLERRCAEVLLREAGVTRTRAEGTERHVSLRRDDLEETFPGLLEVLVA